MLYREIIAVYSQIHTKHINTLCGQNVELYIKTQSVPRSKHSVSVIKTSQLMLYREIIAVCCEVRAKQIHVNKLSRKLNFLMFNLVEHNTVVWIPRSEDVCGSWGKALRFHSVIFRWRVEFHPPAAFPFTGFPGAYWMFCVDYEVGLDVAVKRDALVPSSEVSASHFAT